MRELFLCIIYEAITINILPSKIYSENQFITANRTKKTLTPKF